MSTCMCRKATANNKSPKVSLQNGLNYPFPQFCCIGQGGYNKCSIRRQYLLVTLADYHCLIMCIRIQLGTQGAETPPISLGTISNQVCTIIIISLILIRPGIQCFQFVHYCSVCRQFLDIIMSRRKVSSNKQFD